MLGCVAATTAVRACVRACGACCIWREMAGGQTGGGGLQEARAAEHTARVSRRQGTNGCHMQAHAVDGGPVVLDQVQAQRAVRVDVRVELRRRQAGVQRWA